MKKKKPRRADDRHGPSRMFRVPAPMATLLDQLGRAEVGSTAAEQLRIAVRERLQRKGMLPAEQA